MSNNQAVATTNTQMLAASMQATGSGGAVVAFAPTDFNGLMAVAAMMADAGVAVPKHLRGNPGMCLSVCMVAYPNGFNPYLLASDTFVVNDILSYGAKSIAAMVNNSPRLVGRLHFQFGGQWPKRTITVTGLIRGDDREKSMTYYAETISVRNSPNWKAQPDQQFVYWAERAWARVYMPEILLGLLAEDEARDVATGTAQTLQSTPSTAQSGRPQRSDFGSGEVSASVEAQVADAEIIAPVYAVPMITGEFEDIEGAEAAITALVATADQIARTDGRLTDWLAAAKPAIDAIHEAEGPRSDETRRMHAGIEAARSTWEAQRRATQKADVAPGKSIERYRFQPLKGAAIIDLDAMDFAHEMREALAGLGKADREKLAQLNGGAMKRLHEEESGLSDGVMNVLGAA